MSLFNLGAVRNFIREVCESDLPSRLACHRRRRKSWHGTTVVPIKSAVKWTPHHPTSPPPQKTAHQPSNAALKFLLLKSLESNGHSLPNLLNEILLAAPLKPSEDWDNAVVFWGERITPNTLLRWTKITTHTPSFFKACFVFYALASFLNEEHP